MQKTVDQELILEKSSIWKSEEKGVSKEEWEEMDSQPGQKQGKWDVPEVKVKIAP